MDLGDFRRKGVIELLIYLLQYPKGRRKVDFRKDTGINSYSALNAHKILLEHGLITGLQYLDSTTVWTLTDLGKRIAVDLEPILTFLDGIKRVNGFEMQLKNEEYPKV